MCSRVLALVLSVVFLLSGVFAAGPASAMPDSHRLPFAAAALAEAPAAEVAPELPASAAIEHDQADSLLDVPDQLQGPQALRRAALQAWRPDSDVTADLTHPHLAGPQRPPCASSRSA
ncbi:MAG: hypothetical protein H7322_18355 [Ramlibacter sp.]|nr:hypothetical protein [Ramlibacter sp.]